ncbi:Aldolase-type TIM barrel [Cynara cardunculus var. scolymus]|uniref:Aldolase-type TIM barrel n=1 Tax=Cynara cardunculus var. scolymus TaxID=59895 RepID=A0A103XD67_CYNCS|nr:Aldolase-type TIM barrel [Cynara cardunculus var. scolymus]
MVVEEGSPRSPEAKLGLEVEDLWDVQEPQLSPTEKLNACFESIPVSQFPQASSSQVIEIKSDASLGEAVRLLSQNKILSAPVVDVDAPEDSSWMDRYLGIVEFAGIVVWILHQSEKNSGIDAADVFARALQETTGPAVAAAASGMSSPRYRSSQPGSPKTAGNFFELLTSSDFYKNTKVKDISGSFRWAPFLALQPSNSFLTMLLLLSKYRMKSIPVVDLGERKIDNIITQSAVFHMLEEYEDEPVLQAFRMMQEKGVGGVPVVASGRNKMIAVKNYLKENEKALPVMSGMITCRKEDTLKDVIMKLDSMKGHRIYVVDEQGNLEGLITLRDIISRLVHEPRGYFGDFFDGVLPLPQNSRV